MLDNTKRGFAEEIALTLSLTLLIWISGFLPDYLSHDMNRMIQDIFIVFPLALFLSFFTFRVIRASVIYRNANFLGILFFILLPLLAVSGSSFFKDMSLDNVVLFFFFLGVSSLVLLILRFRRKIKLYAQDTPMERIAVLRAVLTRRQKLTLIFPDSYLKFLETDDKRYLRSGENA